MNSASTALRDAMVDLVVLGSASLPAGQWTAALVATANETGFVGETSATRVTVSFSDNGGSVNHTALSFGAINATVTIGAVVLFKGSTQMFHGSFLTPQIWTSGTAYQVEANSLFISTSLT